MNPSIRLCLVLHNHQPVGNFEHVMAQAFEDSYRPFLDVFEEYPDVKMALHTSGPLIEWLDEVHPEYMSRLCDLVRAGRVEIVGGAYYEPILTMIPRRDRQGQIASFSEWLNRRFDTQVRGMWVPERVWEQSLTADIAEAGIQYSVLDDFHFRNAGLREDDLYGHYVTEDEGQKLFIFPGSEQLRYLIPFSEPGETVGYLRGLAEKHPGSIAVFGDDGEKFGTWPDTKAHVYDNGWLHRFFQALTDNKDWLISSTLAECVDNVPPVGKIYLPDGSYREMTEWALPVSRQQEFDHLQHEMEHDARWPAIKQFTRGGFWRNFKIKYPESDQMYSRMIAVSNKLKQVEATADPENQEWIDWARRELYRGQCNCSYWHGAFGGIYLPHLRNAVYNHLIASENLIERAEEKVGPFVEASADDYDFDGFQEVRLGSNILTAWLDPQDGGTLYELDVKSICHNLGATIARREEAYHEKIRHGNSGGADEVKSIHDRVVFKQEGLDQRLQYDVGERRTLIDHFYDVDATLEQVMSGEAMERGDFAAGAYVTKVRRNPQRMQVQMTRQGNAWGIPLTLTKGVTLSEGGAVLEIGYLIEGLPDDQAFHFAVEFNFAGMPSGADDRFFYTEQLDQKLGQLGELQDLRDQGELHLVDEWLGIDVGLTVNRPTNFWTYPTETVSQSEGGFELVHQSVTVLPHWVVRPDKDGRWMTTINLQIDTALAENRMINQGAEIASQ